MLIRVVLGALVLLNLVAAGFVMFPPGGSPEELNQQLASLQSQVLKNRKTLETTRQHVAAVEKGRSQGEEFLSNYFLATRTASATILDDLSAAANATKIKPGQISYSTEPIEGSNDLSMMTINANYDGTYADLMNFIHRIDQSQRLLIIESLNAAPQAGSNTLSVNMKIDAFVHGEAGE
jgi:hypothetical protein